MNVTVFGLGYVGCVTAACLARVGHAVTGVDVNAEKVSMINAGQSPIVEPGLADLIASVVSAGRLHATTDSADAVRKAHVVLICVGTPSLPHGRPDVDAIDRVGREIGAAVEDGRSEPLTVVLRSTVLPGTTDRVLLPALRAGLESGGGGRVRVAVNPEFMREGSAIADFDNPPMILVGAEDPSAAATVRSLYSGVRAPFVRTSLRSAELVKGAANAFHGMKVCFANEIANLAEAMGAKGEEGMTAFRRYRQQKGTARCL